MEICHIPPGDPENPQTLKLRALAARAHLSHGDTLGSCEDDEPQVTDTLAPVITGISSTPSTTSAVITWITNENSTSFVEYADESLSTASSTIEVEDETLVMSHSVELTGLATSTQYFYIVRSEDEAGNLATSIEESFTTSL